MPAAAPPRGLQGHGPARRPLRPLGAEPPAPQPLPRALCPHRRGRPRALRPGEDRGRGRRLQAADAGARRPLHHKVPRGRQAPQEPGPLARLSRPGHPPRPLRRRQEGGGPRGPDAQGPGPGAQGAGDRDGGREVRVPRVQRERRLLADEPGAAAQGVLQAPAALDAHDGGGGQGAGGRGRGVEGQVLGGARAGLRRLRGGRQCPKVPE
mmetsp:Transcript_15185/g.38128  ORF Transcript_15185/g.38128 Transcript_15185/m.38128 type:complete len:209 (-) Transcript_15185:1378-2004(-)